MRLVDTAGKEKGLIEALKWCDKVRFQLKLELSTAADPLIQESSSSDRYR